MAQYLEEYWVTSRINYLNVKVLINAMYKAASKTSASKWNLKAILIN